MSEGLLYISLHFDVVGLIETSEPETSEPKASEPKASEPKETGELLLGPCAPPLP